MTEIDYSKSTYQWKPDGEKILRITKSSLSDFGFCPYQYYQNRVLDNKIDRVTPDMTTGINVHDSVELFWIRVMSHVPKILKLADGGKHDEAFKLMVSCHPEPETPYEFREEKNIFQWTVWQYQRLLITRGERFLPVLNEESLDAIKKMSIGGDDDSALDVHFVGIIDRAFETDDGSLALMELKTGKWKGNRWKVSSMRDEMEYYRMLVDMQPNDYPWKGKVTHWGWLYPDGGKNDGDGIHFDYEEVEKRYTPKRVNKAINTLIESHIREDFMPKPSNGKCVYCDHKKICPAWRGSDAIKYWTKSKPRFTGGR